MKFIYSIVLSTLFPLTACSMRDHTPPTYAPGLGEIMSLSGMRHVKLWYAGQAKNWQLAAYEIDELREGLEEASKFHPTHKSIKTPIAQLISSTMDKPLGQVEKAVNEKDFSAFAIGYDSLTAACNACHQMTDFAFNIVTKPEFNPFPSQQFHP